MLWTLAAVPLYAAYWAALGLLAELAARHAPLLAAAPTLTTSISEAWLHHAPLLGAAVLIGYLTHLQLDDMNGAGQQLAWPLSRRSITSPLLSIPVGGWREALLVSAPLTVVMLTALWHVSKPDVQFSALESGDQFISCLITPSGCDLQPPALSLEPAKDTHAR